MSGRAAAADLLQPCGTLAAHRRHLRRGEKPCGECAAANRRAVAGRKGHDANAQSLDLREIRNNVAFIPYVYRGAKLWREGSRALGIRVHEPRPRMGATPDTPPAAAPAPEAAPAAPEPDDGRCPECGYVLAWCGCPDNPRWRRA